MFFNLLLSKRSLVLVFMIFSLLLSCFAQSQMPPTKKNKPAGANNKQVYQQGAKIDLEPASQEQMDKLSAEAQKKMWTHNLLQKAAELNWDNFNWTYLYAFNLHTHINEIDFLRITSQKNFSTIIQQLAEKLVEKEPDIFPCIEFAQFHILSAIQSHCVQLESLEQNSVNAHPNWSLLSSFQQIPPTLSSQFSLDVIPFDELLMESSDDILTHHWSTFSSSELTSITLQNTHETLVDGLYAITETTIQIPNTQSQAQPVTVAQLLTAPQLTSQAILSNLIAISDGYYPLLGGGYIQREDQLLRTIMQLLAKIWQHSEVSLQQQLAQLAITVFHLNFLAIPAPACRAAVPAPAEPHNPEGFTWEELSQHITASCDQKSYWLCDQIQDCNMALIQIIQGLGVEVCAEVMLSQHIISAYTREEACNKYNSASSRAGTLCAVIRSHFGALRQSARFSRVINEFITLLQYFHAQAPVQAQVTTMILFLLGRVQSPQ